MRGPSVARAREERAESERLDVAVDIVDAIISVLFLKRGKLKLAAFGASFLERAAEGLSLKERIQNKSTIELVVKERKERECVYVR